MNTMKIKLLFLLFLLFLFVLIPGISSATESRSLDIEFAFSDPGNPASQLIGFRLYKEDLQVCETDDPGATRIACDLFTEDGTFDFTLTAFYADGSESPPSTPFPFIIESAAIPPPDPDPLQAIISTTKTNGEVPLNIIFSGADSKGEISTYSWVFGDGTTAAGPEVTHNFTTQGTYTVSLTVSRQQETSPPTTTTIVAQPNTSNQEPPIAVLSTSAATGNAPLTVTFDGSSSTAPNSSIIDYIWTFGDGLPTTTGERVSYTYTETGTYYPELTVLNEQSLNDHVSTPIIVTEAIVQNEKPTAVISTDQTQNDEPLTVSFDASQSSDPDGAITKYKWNFGDGTTGNSQAVKHTYTEAATYTVSLEVTDDQGGTAEVTKDVFFNAEPTWDLNFEVGKVTIDHQWVRVLFENDFIDPVVIAGPPSSSGSDPVLIRIRNIDPEDVIDETGKTTQAAGFEVRLQEWDYLDGGHTDESFSYIVMEKGVHTLYNDIKVEAGNFTGSSRFQKISLQQPYDLTPVILTQIITENEADAVTGRIRKSGLNSFEYKLQEMEKTKRNHATETIGYIAWEPGTGELPGLLYEAGLTPDSVTHDWFNLTFQTDFPDLPLFIANMQTQDGGDTAVLRNKDMSPSTTQIKIEEEQSKDDETRHTSEVVGYLIIGSAAE